MTISVENKGVRTLFRSRHVKVAATIPEPATEKGPDTFIRGGFTILEVVASMAILTFAIALVGQLGAWTLAERVRSRDHQAAVESAANVLESARACPWDDLTPAWAASQRLPPFLAGRQWQLTIQVAAEKQQPLTKRVTVEIQALHQSGKLTPPVRMIGIFSARSAALSGGKP
jgi:type II secretory pathway pseudopilin PulG